MNLFTCDIRLIAALVQNENLCLSDIVAVTLYIKDMSNYKAINDVYVSWLGKRNPPVRVCVECPLNIHVMLDAIAYKENQESGDKCVYKRQTMHVQSISHWAPANIGPYSQAVCVSAINKNILMRYYWQFCIKYFLRKLILKY